MTFDLIKYMPYLEENKHGDGWVVVKSCPENITQELKEINQEYLDKMGSNLIVFTY